MTNIREFGLNIHMDFQSGSPYIFHGNY